MNAYVEARRELGLTAEVERRLLTWLAARVPRSIGPDHLTLLGFLSLAGGGAAYALASHDLRWLHGVNLGLVFNWLGDSLDGTLARFRRQPRPRYGFYVDHFVDALGAVALLTGLAASGLASGAVAAALLVAYLLVSVEIALAAHVTGVFRISRGPVGGTELRMLLLGANLAAMAWPRIRLAGFEVGFFDLVAGPAALGLIWLAIGSGLRTARRLDDEDRSRGPQRG